MIVAVDASVALKWFLNISGNESDSERALALLARIGDGSVGIVQPVHFIAEVVAVLAREKPGGALQDLSDLLELDLRLVDTPETYATALDLSIRYRHHLFDTLYHAVALQVPEAFLVTADRHYYDKARREGRIALLTDWECPPG